MILHQPQDDLPAVIKATAAGISGSSGSDSAADCYRMRPAQNRRSQFPQRYCLIDINLNNLSSKSRRRERLIRLLLQSGHVITRKCLYSLIGRSKYPNSAYVVPSYETSIRECINPQILFCGALPKKKNP